METLKHNISSIYGKDGKLWLENLDYLVEKISQEWNLRDLKVFDNLSYNYVVSGFREDIPVVLKVGFDVNLLKQEVYALQTFNGQNVAKVLEWDKETGAILLQQAVPGIPLTDSFLNHDTEAITIACDIIKKMEHSEIKLPANLEDFITLDEQFSDLYKEWGIPEHHAEKSRIIYTHLRNTAGKAMLLHGDLHHDNILRNNTNAHDDYSNDCSGDWLVIDPKGLIGEREYEVGSMLRNPISDLLQHNNITELLNKRLDLFSQKLDMDRTRILQWAYVQSVLAACWCIGDHLDPQDFLDMSDVLYKMC